MSNLVIMRHFAPSRFKHLSPQPKHMSAPSTLPGHSLKTPGPEGFIVGPGGPFAGPKSDQTKPKMTHLDIRAMPTQAYRINYQTLIKKQLGGDAKKNGPSGHFKLSVFF